MKCNNCNATLGQNDIHEGGKFPVSDGMPGIKYYFCQNDGYTRAITRKAPSARAEFKRPARKG
jgi:hypothetical protein